MVHLAWRSAINQATHTSLSLQEAVGFLGSISIGLCWEDKHFQTIKAVRATSYILPCLSSSAFQFVFFWGGGSVGEWVGVKCWLPHFLMSLSQSWCYCVLTHAVQMPTHRHFQAQGLLHKLWLHPELKPSLGRWEELQLQVFVFFLSHKPMHIYSKQSSAIPPGSHCKIRNVVLLNPKGRPWDSPSLLGKELTPRPPHLHSRKSSWRDLSRKVNHYYLWDLLLLRGKNHLYSWAYAYANE